MNTVINIASLAEEQELSSLIMRGHYGRHYLDMLITPSMAQIMLVRNTGNRPVTRANVVRHIDRLKSGRFVLTPHGISFSKEGVLNDGQHRLLAIVESGIPGMMHVAFGCERDEFTVIDGQRPRSASDMLAIDGQKNTAIKAAVGARLLALETKQLLGGDAQMIHTFTAGLNQAVLETAAQLASNSKRVTNPTVVGLAYYWIYMNTRSKEERVTEFFDLLIHGGFPAGSLQTKLRDKLIAKERFNPKAITTAGTAYNVSAAAAITIAWNQWTLGRKKNTPLQWSHVVQMPDVE